MDRILRNWHIGVALAVILVCLGGLYLELTTARNENVQSKALAVNQVQTAALLKVAQGDAAQIEATLEHINRPCSGPSGANACGTLAEINESVIRIGDAVVTMQMQVKQSGNLMNAAAKAIGSASDDVHATATALTGTANAATTALGGIRPLLDKLTEDAAQLQPVEKHLDALIEQAQPVVVNAQSMTKSGATILSDGADEADKLTHPPKKKLTFWGGAWVAVQWIHKFEPPIF